MFGWRGTPPFFDVQTAGTPPFFDVQAAGTPPFFDVIVLPHRR
jgi:hypothetical protein